MGVSPHLSHPPPVFLFAVCDLWTLSVNAVARKISLLRLFFYFTKITALAVLFFINESARSLIPFQSLLFSFILFCLPFLSFFPWRRWQRLMPSFSAWAFSISTPRLSLCRVFFIPFFLSFFFPPSLSLSLCSAALPVGVKLGECDRKREAAGWEWKSVEGEKKREKAIMKSLI